MPDNDLNMECFVLAKTRDLTSLQDTLVTAIKQGEYVFALLLHHMVGLMVDNFSFTLQSLVQELESEIKCPKYSEKCETAVNHSNLTFPGSEILFT